MVQEGAAAAPAPVVGAPGAAKKKKNKSKNKKKTGTVPVAGQPNQQQAGGSESRSRTSSDTAAGQSPQQNEQPKPAAPVAAPIEPIVNRALPIAKEDRKADDLFSNLAREFAENYAVYSNYSEVRDAEKLYYQHLAKNKVSVMFLELTFPRSLVEFPRFLAWSLLPCFSFVQFAFSFFSTLHFCFL